MPAKPRLSTVFSQTLDRAVFGTFFLGAVVPLVALGWVAHRFVLPQLTSDGLAATSVLGPLVGVGALTLASFFALRRIVGTTVTELDVHNQRLDRLIAASRSLSEAPHAQAVAERACRFAVEMTGATGAAALLAEAKGGALEVYEVSSDAVRELMEAHDGVLSELTQSVQASGRSGAVSGDRGAPIAAMALPIAVGDDMAGVLLVVSPDASRPIDPSAVDAVATLASLTGVALENGRLKDSQRNFFAHTTELLASALDQHVENRHGHAKAVARICNRIGRAMGLDEPELQTLHYASLLHDIGMLKIDHRKHTTAAACRQHAAVGHRMLSRIHLWRHVAPVVEHHHERFDGAGYPDGLAGETIPLAARIIAVADAVDAMRRAEGDRPSMSPEEVVTEVRANAGSQFDPEVVDVFAELVAQGHIETSPDA